ncbi:MAG: hypothetical protein ILP10_08895 [Lachnospiraceae bacterium]|nr:hypothetical protein [Lachnospiraceae bacterium]
MVHNYTSLGIKLWMAGFGKDLKRLGINVARDCTYGDETDADGMMEEESEQS